VIQECNPCWGRLCVAMILLLNRAPALAQTGMPSLPSVTAEAPAGRSVSKPGLSAADRIRISDEAIRLITTGQYVNAGDRAKSLLVATFQFAGTIQINVTGPEFTLVFTGEWVPSGGAPDGSTSLRERKVVTVRLKRGSEPEFTVSIEVQALPVPQSRWPEPRGLK
jgi:hypothetical protein